MSDWTIPRESREWVGPLTVTVDGQAVTNYEVAVTDRDTRPTEWASPDVIDSRLGVLVGPGTARPLGRDSYRIWVRVTGDVEAPVLDDVGTITIT